MDTTFDLGGSWRKLLCEFPGGGGDAQVVPGAFESSGSPKEEGPPGLHQIWMFCTRTQPVSSGSPLRDSNAAWNTATEQSGVAGNGLSATSTTLLGHNGRHTVRIVAWGGGNAGGAWSQSADSPQGLGDFPFEQQRFDGTAWEPQGFNNALPVVGRNVQNLVIKEVTPIEEFLVTKDASSPLQFSITLEDQNPDVPYTIEVSIRRTVDPLVIIKTLTRTETGLNHILTWDYSNDDGEFENAIGGYFTFDVAVSQEGELPQTYRSPTLHITEDQAYLVSDEDGLFEKNGSGNYHAIFKYKLSEPPKAASLNVNFYHNLGSVGEESGLSDQNRWEIPIEKWVALSDAPTIRCITQAKDDHADLYRDHQAKPMLNWNKAFQPYIKRVALTLKLTGQANAPFQEWRQLVWLKNGDNLGWVTYPWQVTHTWSANSGEPGALNSDVPSAYWSENGAIPVSNPAQNNVHENENRHWKVMVDTNYKITLHGSQRLSDIETWNRNVVFRWRDANRELIDYGTASDPIYRAWRFQIANGNEGDQHHPQIAVPGAIARDDGTFYRWRLRVHDDGETDGSQGCTALPGGKMPEVWNLFWDIQRAKDRTAPQGNWIPYEVYDHNGVPAPTTGSNGVPTGGPGGTYPPIYWESATP